MERVQHREEKRRILAVTAHAGDACRCGQHQTYHEHAENKKTFSLKRDYRYPRNSATSW